MEPLHMDKFQHLLDTVFGQLEAARAPQEPNEFTIERERVIEETAKKVAALREMRLAREAPER